MKILTPQQKAIKQYMMFYKDPAIVAKHLGIDEITVKREWRKVMNAQTDQIGFDEEKV